jgi:hypothetical protein
MLKRLLAISSLAATLLLSPAASADEPFKVGGTFDIGTPYVAATGLEVRLPLMPWFKLGVSGTYSLSPGVRGNILIDPIKFPVVPVANAEIGYQSPFTIPGVSNSPTATFTYETLDGGLGFGRRDRVRFFIMGGMTHIDGSVSGTDHLFTLSNGVAIGNAPTFDGWIPNAKLGFSVLF